MSVTLNVIRYHTPDEPYHYTVDNRPLGDLELNDIALKAAVDMINTNTIVASTQGDWSTLQLNLNLNPSRGKAIAYRIKIWAIEDQSLSSTQNSTMYEELVMGYNAVGGAVTLINSVNIVNQKIGANTLTITITGIGDNLNITFSGYTGINGLVNLRAEKYGL